MSEAGRNRLTRSEALEVLLGLAAVGYWIAETAGIAHAIGAAGIVAVVGGLFGRRVFGWA